VVVVLGAETAAHDAVLGHLARQQDLDDVVELHAGVLQGVPQLLGLHDGAGEAVQEPAVGAGALEHVEDHGDGDVVGHQLTAVDVLLGLLPSSVPPPMCLRKMAPDSMWSRWISP
jgi:hypothetical protein